MRARVHVCAYVCRGRVCVCDCIVGDNACRPCPLKSGRTGPKVAVVVDPGLSVCLSVCVCVCVCYASAYMHARMHECSVPPMERKTDCDQTLIQTACSRSQRTSLLGVMHHKVWACRRVCDGPFEIVHVAVGCLAAVVFVVAAAVC